MNVSHRFVPFLLALLPIVPVAAQDLTLLAAARGAEFVVQATVLAASDPSPDWHRLEFRTEAVLKGDAPREFRLLEPAGACCGRSLFALQPGQSVLLFLRRSGPNLHPYGGARGVLPADPSVRTHVQQLLATTDGPATARLLAAALQSNEPRIADDAAQALATLPVLQLPNAERTVLREALQDALQRGTTRTAPLLETVVRLADPSLLDVVLPAYLDAGDDRAPLLRRGLLRCPSTAVAAQLPLHPTTNPQQALRAAELLVALPEPEARPSLERMLRQAPHPRVQLCLAEAMLAAGATEQQLRSTVPEPVLRLAEQRHREPPRFRNLRPGRP
ncbi:MAG: hypothetical protein MUC36_08455 [Planctomycetes bacterium]|jgi:hypothetical protein|nr:hypothetical protein [Planctomycetota bacterium]